MDNVALEPIQKLDTLAEKYNQSLQQIEAYAKFPNAYRLDVARQSLTLVNEVLAVRDETNFLDYIQSRLDERLSQGFLVETFLQALSALEELLVAETRTLDEAVFLWRMFAHTRDMISRHTVKMLRSSQEVFPTTADTPSLLPTEALSTISPAKLVHDYVLTPVQDIENISLLDLISLENLQQIQDAFAEATGVASIITDLSGVPITAASNFSQVCELVRATTKGYQHCITSDRELGERAKVLMRPTFQECLSCGFADASAPIIVGGQHIANWLIGQTNVMEAGRDRIAAYAREIGADVEEMVAAYRTIPGMPIEKFQKILDLLWHFAREISTAGYNILQLQQDIAQREQVEAALQESERRMADIIDFLPDAALVLDKDGVVQAWNRAMEQLTGVSAAQMVGKGNYEYAIPFYGERKPLLIDQVRNPAGQNLEERYIEVLQFGHTLSGAVYVTLKGQERYLTINAAPLYDSAGNIIGAVETIRDETIRRRLEVQAEQSLVRRAKQVETSTEVAQQIAAVPAVDELFKTVVNLVQDRFGYYHVHIYMIEDDYLVMREGVGEAGRVMKAAGHKIVRIAEKSLVARAARTGQPVLISNVTQEPGWLPNRLLPHTQSELAVPIKLGDEVLGVLDVQSNLVDGVTAEDELLLAGLCGQIASAIQTTQLLEETTIFRTFAETSGQGIAMATLDGKMTYVNPTLRQLLGIDPTAPLNQRSYTSFYPHQYQVRLEREVFPAVRKNGRWQGESVLQARGGRLIPVLEDFFVIRAEDGQPLYLADIVTDITQRKRTEADLEDRVRELTALQQVMSREGWAAWQKTSAFQPHYLFDQISVHTAAELPLADSLPSTGQNDRSNGVNVTAPIQLHQDAVGLLGVYDDPANPLTPEELTLVEEVSEQVALALENARLFSQTQQALSEQQSTASLLSERVKELNCLNDIGREVVENPPIPEFLEWVTQRIPPAMQYPEQVCVAIEYQEVVYGNPAALETTTKIVHGLRISGQVVGRIHIAYLQPHNFVDEESALLGSIASRVSSYIESHQLNQQTHLALSEVRQSQEFLRTLINNIPLPIFYKNRQGAYLGFNKAFLDYLGLPEEAVMGKTVFDLNTDQELAARYHQADLELFDNPRVQVYEAAVKYADGSLRSVIFNKAPFRNSDGSIAGLIGTMVDITDRQQAEEIIQRERSLLRAVIDSIPDLVFFKDTQSVYLGCNKAFEDFAGRPENNLVGQTDVDMFGAEVGNFFREMDLQMMAEGQARRNEEWVDYPDGRHRLLDTLKAPFFNREGVTLGIIGISRDITERKQIEEALRENESRLSEATNIAQLGYWELNFETQVFTFTDQLYALLRTTAAQEGGYQMPVMQYAQKFVHPDDAHLVGDEVERSINTTDPNFSTQIEHRIIRADGSQGFILVRFRVVKDEHGRTIKSIGANQDITERKLAEAERERLLDEVQAAYRQYVSREWEQFLSDHHNGVWRVEHQVQPVPQAANTLETQIALRGQPIGRLSLNELDPNRQWTVEEMALVETISEQLALTVENLRLFDSAQQRATREQLTREITDKMRAAPDVESIIQTGLGELAKTLGISRSYVKLSPQTTRYDE